MLLAPTIPGSTSNARANRMFPHRGAVVRGGTRSDRLCVDAHDGTAARHLHERRAHEAGALPRLRAVFLRGQTPGPGGIQRARFQGARRSVRPMVHWKGSVSRRQMEARAVRRSIRRQLLRVECVEQGPKDHPGVAAGASRFEGGAECRGDLLALIRLEGARQWLCQHRGQRRLGALPRAPGQGKGHPDEAACERRTVRRAVRAYAERADRYGRSYAWRRRASGYANTVAKEGWELFRERLDKAKDILTRLHASGAQCAAPYALTLSVLTDTGASETELAAVFERGVLEYPEYHDIYFAMARHYEPKWGGSVEQYEHFARTTANRTKDFEGMGMYARLYWLVDTRKDIPFANDSAQAPYWSALHAGYEDLMRLYPSSMHNLGKYAGVACRSTDGALYRSLRSKIAGYESAAQMLDPIDVCDRRHNWTP